ncbi:MAG: hypothetical protein AAGA37_06600 [Actinomycetota bacterium]
MIEYQVASSEEEHRVHEALLVECCEQRDAGRALVSPLTRFGFSGAKLYRIYFGERDTRPYVGKIHSWRKLNDEHSRSQQVRHHFAVQESTFVDLDPDGDDVNRLTMLLYPLVEGGSDEAGQIAELGDIFFDPTNPSGASDALEMVYDSASSPLGRAKPAIKKGEFGEVLERYFRDEDAEASLNSVFGRNETITGFDGIPLTNPMVLRSRLGGTYDFHHSPVHGDLHAQNVLLDRLGNPHLIDYAWADAEGPTAIDYTVMEATIRLMRFPHTCNPSTLIRVQALLNEDFPRLALGREEALLESDPMRSTYVRAAKLVDRIRTGFRRVCGNTSHDEYLLALFATLYGMVAYRDYPLLPTLHVLNSIAGEIDPELAPSS